MTLCVTDHKKLFERLNRIEGQLRGIRKMIDDDRYCMDILKQVAATSGALRSMGMVILEEHLKGHVTKAIKDEHSEEGIIQEIIDIFNKFSQ